MRLRVASAFKTQAATTLPFVSARYLRSFSTSNPLTLCAGYLFCGSIMPAPYSRSRTLARQAIRPPRSSRRGGGCSAPRRPGSRVRHAVLYVIARALGKRICGLQKLLEPIWLSLVSNVGAWSKCRTCHSNGLPSTTLRGPTDQRRRPPG